MELQDRAPKKSRKREEEPPDKGLDSGFSQTVTPPQNSQARSYRASLLNEAIETERREEDIGVVIEEEDVVRGEENGIPSIRFSDRVRSQLRDRMANSVVIKLLGRSIGFTPLSSRLQALWKPKGQWQVMDLENGYFLIKFKEPRDYTIALTGGPWVIYGHYLTVQPWSPSFSTLQDHPHDVVVWIRLPGLPEDLYEKNAVREVGKTIGSVIKVDYHTENGMRGKFARMAVWIDLRSRIKSKIMIDGRVQSVEYESLPNVCFACGHYGHNIEQCPSRAKAPEENGDKDDEEEPVRKISETEALQALRQRVEKEDFGDWMLVDGRKKRPVKGKAINEGGKSGRNSGNGGIVINQSKFGALSDMGEKFQEKVMGRSNRGT